MTAPNSPIVKWWDPNNVKDAAQIITTAVEKLEQDGRRDNYRAFEEMYGGSTITSHVAAVFGRRDLTVMQRSPVGRALVDTQMNRIGRARPRPWPVTRDGDWDAQCRAEMLDGWLDGYYDYLRLDDKMRYDLLFNGLVLGTGVLKGEVHCGEPNVYGVHPSYIHVDKWEEYHGCVRTLYQSIAVDREVLAAQWPDHKDAIKNADAYHDDKMPKADHYSSDLVRVTEGWRLPTGRDKDGNPTGGYHYICIPKVVLNMDDREWKSNHFPFVFYRYRKRPRSFFGMGLIESLGAQQIDLDDLDDIVAEAYELFVPKIMYRSGSVPKGVFNNDVGGSIEFTGDPPLPWSPPPISPEFLKRAHELELKMRRHEGITDFSAEGTKPAGLNAGIAIERYESIDNERHALPSQGYEQASVDLAELLIDLAEEVAEDKELSEKSKLRVLGGKEMYDFIEYADARMDRRDRVMKVWPVSRLSRSAVGQLEEVDKMRQMGLITDPDDQRELLDIPDVKRNNSLVLAGRKLARKMVYNALRGKPCYVHPYMPLDFLVRHATQQRALAELKGAPDESLQKLDDLIGAAINEQQKMLDAQQPPMPAGPPGMPMGGPPMGSLSPVDPLAAGAMPPSMPGPMGPVPMPPVMPPGMPIQ